MKSRYSDSHDKSNLESKKIAYGRTSKLETRCKQIVIVEWTRMTKAGKAGPLDSECILRVSKQLEGYLRGRIKTKRGKPTYVSKRLMSKLASNLISDICRDGIASDSWTYTTTVPIGKYAIEKGPSPDDESLFQVHWKQLEGNFKRSLKRKGFGSSLLSKARKMAMQETIDEAAALALIESIEEMRLPVDLKVHAEHIVRVLAERVLWQATKRHLERSERNMTVALRTTQHILERLGD